MANLLNKFFSSVFTKEDVSSIPTAKIVFDKKLLCSFSVTPDQVAKKLAALKVGSAPGPDKLSAKLLKALSEVLSVPVGMIFMKSISEGKAPHDWNRQCHSSVQKGFEKCPWQLPSYLTHVNPM